MVQTNEEIINEINSLINNNYDKCCKKSKFNYLIPLLLLFLVLIVILFLFLTNKKSTPKVITEVITDSTPEVITSVITDSTPESTPETSSRPKSENSSPSFNIINNQNPSNDTVITNGDRYVTTTNIAEPVRFNKESQNTSQNVLKTDDISSTIAENGSVKSQNTSSENTSLSEKQNIPSSEKQNLQPKTSSKNSSEKTFLNQFTNNLIGNGENYFTRNTNIFKDLDISNSENIPDAIKSLIPIKNNTEKNKSFCYYNYSGQENTCYL